MSIFLGIILFSSIYDSIKNAHFLLNCLITAYENCFKIKKNKNKWQNCLRFLAAAQVLQSPPSPQENKENLLKKYLWKFSFQGH